MNIVLSFGVESWDEARIPLSFWAESPVRKDMRIATPIRSCCEQPLRLIPMNSDCSQNPPNFLKTLTGIIGDHPTEWKDIGDMRSILSRL